MNKRVKEKDGGFMRTKAMKEETAVIFQLYPVQIIKVTYLITVLDLCRDEISLKQSASCVLKTVISSCQEAKVLKKKDKPVVES